MGKTGLIFSTLKDATITCHAFFFVEPVWKCALQCFLTFLKKNIEMNIGIYGDATCCEDMALCKPKARNDDRMELLKIVNIDIFNGRN